MIRNINKSWVAGVASGMAHKMNWPVGIIRTFYVATFFLLGLGFLLYVAAWLANPLEDEGQMNLRIS